MPTATLRLRIISRWTGGDESARRRLSDGQSTAARAITRAGSAVGRTIRSLVNMRTIAVMFAPAMFTLGKAALIVAAGLVTMGVAASLAAAPWVALAVTAARNADKMGAAGARFERGATGVRDAWMELARDTAGLTLGPLTDVLNGVADAIPKLEPLVRDVAPEFARIGRDLRDWLSGSGFERFINNLRIAGVPAFRSLVEASRDAVTTLGIAFRTFLPMSQQIAEDIEGSVAILRRRASGGSFDRMLENFQRDLPEVNRFLRAASESLGIIAQLLDDVGPGQLSAISTGLDLFNRVDPRALIDIVLGYATGRLIVGLIPLLGALMLLRSMRVQIAAAISLGGVSGALSGAATSLFAMAAALRMLARAVRAPQINSSQLDRIKQIWDAMPKNARATVTINTSQAQVALMGIGSTWAVVSTLGTLTFTARANIGMFTAVVAVVVAMWTALRVVALVPPIFTASSASTAAVGMAQIILAWTRVRVAAAVPALFRASATPGNVTGVAGTIIGMWIAVRALAIVPVIFRATASGGPALAGMALARAAWARVRSLPRSVQFTARVNAGPAVSGSNAAVAAWRRIFGLARTWMGVASVSVSGGFSGLGGGGTYNVRINNPYVGTPAAPFIPFRPPSPDFPDLGGFSPTGPGFVGGDVSGANFDPGDFAGGFAQGGPVGPMKTVRSYDFGDEGEHIHIWDDVWIESKEDLVNLLLEASKKAR